MAKGTIAKDVVISKLQEAFGDDFVGIADKKVYVWADDGGERVQICIAMTCPKVFIESGDTPVPTTGGTTTAPKAAGLNFEISESETQAVANLMKELGVDIQG